MRWRVHSLKEKVDDFHAKDQESVFVVAGLPKLSLIGHTVIFIFIERFQVMQSFVCCETINFKNEKLFLSLSFFFSISEIEDRASTSAAK